jgi:hypothetical protein
MSGKVKAQTLEQIDDNRITPRGLLRYAEVYYHAFDTLYSTDHDTLRFHPAIYYLAAHSLELSLKSILRKQGVTVDHLLNKFGHNLVKLLKTVQNNGYIEINEKETAVIKLLNAYYKIKQLEYFFSSYKEFPNLPDLHMTTLLILDKARNAIET